ncbi:hypothetical protein B0H16DRAFT_1731859 [Mycena metata]|uniref:Uncharacterized protein n=1 Tax=Mycena metata TaxID=1033252 RepID=A0AAD7I3D8_9AGAR|nr:hypothetical protein B0H16DRAFT_1731859 [Mycena metata]
MATNNRVSAHASRNAGKPTQDSAPKKSKRPVGSDALANTKALMTSGQKANKTAVLQLINDFYEYRDQHIDDIWDSQSQDNQMTKEWIRKQMTSSAYAGAARAPNYWNGYVSKVQQELKEEDPHANLDNARAEIARRMEEAGCDSFEDFLSESEKKDLRKEMEDDRGKKHRNCEKIRVMLEGLRERCGVLSLAFIARGNIKDAARAECLYTGGAADFLTDVFKISVVEFLWRYEAYCSMRDDIPRPPKSTIVLWREIVKLTEDGLKLITGHKDVKMFYKHYDYVIRYLLGVELVGLLDNTKAPINPTKITTLARLQSTLDALVTSKMHWRKMTATERSKHVAAMDEAGDCCLRDAKTPRGAHPPKSKETLDLSEDEGEEDVEDKRGDAARDGGKEDVEGKGRDSVSDASEADDDENEEEEEEEEEESAAAAKKTAVVKTRKARAGSPKTKSARKATSTRPTSKTKGGAKAKRAAAKAKDTATKAKRTAAKAKVSAPKAKVSAPKAKVSAPKATAEPRPKPRPLVKTPATKAVEKENAAPTMNELIGVFDANLGETQLRKRKRPAEDEGGGRELVDGAADEVLTTRRGRRTVTSEALEKRAEVMAQLGKRKREKKAK